MQCHARIAVRTVTAPATIVTKQSVGETAAVEKDQHLMTLAQRRLDFVQQFRRQSCGQLKPGDINLPQRWQCSLTCPVC